MKPAFIAVALLWILGSRPTLACDLDDCTLSDAAHRESPKFKELPNDEFAWMNHDLALARTWYVEGRSDRALAIIEGLDYAMRVRQDRMVAVRGRARVLALHTAIEELQVQAGGYPLAALDLPRHQRGRTAPDDRSADTPDTPHTADTAVNQPRPDDAERPRPDPSTRDQGAERGRQEPPDREPAIRDLPRP